MTLQVEIINKGTQSEKDYDLFLNTCEYGFTQQTTLWRDVIQGLGPDEPFFLLARDNGTPVGALPLYLYRGEFGNIMTSVPQPGPHGGIACAADYTDNEQIYRALLDYAIKLSDEKHCCLLTVMTNPFMNDSIYYREFLLPDYELENFTQYIYIPEYFTDSGEPPYLNKGNTGQINSRDRNDIRRNLNKAGDAKILIAESYNADDLDAWYEIHKQRHKEIKAAPLRRELFYSIFEKMVLTGRAKFLTAYHNKRIAGGCFTIFNDQITDLYMMSTDSELIEFGVNYALIDNLLRSSLNSSTTVFNWQSSPSRSSGVYEFKRRWGSREASYFFFTKVLHDISGIIKGDFNEVMGAYKNHFLLPCEVGDSTYGKTFGEFVKTKVRKN